MGLTAEQYYLVNTLTYMSQQGVYSAESGMSVGDFVNGILNSPRVCESISSQYMTQEQIISACEQIRADETLMGMEIAYADRTKGGADRLILTSTSEGQKQAVVAMEGTMGGNEWRDNFTGAGPTDQADGVSTYEQAATLDWFQNDSEVSAVLDSCDSIAVTGHSKGGNKAKYLTLFDDRIEECYSFDGQGFSDDFVMEYSDEIMGMQHKITNINHKADFVNILLNDVGKTHFIEGKDCGARVDKNHSIFSMDEGIPFAENETEQWTVMREADELLNSYLRSLSPQERTEFGENLGEIAAAAFGGNGEGVSDILGKCAMAADFLKYALQYGKSEFIKWLESLVRDVFPWMADALALWRVFITDGEVIVDGGDIRLPSSPAESAVAEGATGASGAAGDRRIRIDTDELLQLASRTRALCASLNDCVSRVNRGAAMCAQQKIDFTMSISCKLVSAGGKVYADRGTPEAALTALSRAAQVLRTETNRLAEAMVKVANLVEATEEGISAGFEISMGEAAPF